MGWVKNVEALSSCLNGLNVKDGAGNSVSVDKGFVKWIKYGERIRKRDRTIYLIGNGASASMASHMSADLAKNALINTEVFFDLSLMTAISNDICFSEVFAEPIKRRMKKGDMVVAISSSGQSENILKAVAEAKRKAGIVVTLSAMKKNNRLRKTGDLNFYVPAITYGLAETCHAAILHNWMDGLSLASE